MAIRFTTTDQASAQGGVKVLGYGVSGAGKTRLCATAPNPFIISAEAGLLSLREYKIPAAEVSTIEELTEVFRWVSGSVEAKRFWTICLDSVSEIAEIILANALKYVKDPRQAYGEVLTRTIELVKSFRDLPNRHVYMSAKIEPMKDEMSGAILYMPSFPGKKLGPEMPYLFSEVFVLREGKTQKGEAFRYLQTRGDLQYVAKDRSGHLAPMEPPDLNEVFNKIMR